MKEEILQKLFSDEPLNREEILFVSMNLKDEEVLPFNHKIDNVYAACGLDKEKCVDLLDGLNGGPKKMSLSEGVEMIESKLMASAKLRRLILIKVATDMSSEHRPIASGVGTMDDIKKLIEMLRKRSED